MTDGRGGGTLQITGAHVHFDRTKALDGAQVNSPFLALRLAEVDGNRTRRTGITRPTRFEGGGVHQALRHLRAAG